MAGSFCHAIRDMALFDYYTVKLYNEKRAIKFDSIR